MHIWLKILLLLGGFMNRQCVHSVIESTHLPVEARDDSNSQEDDIISTSYVLPNQIFNDGKPYYAGKDPISGQLDFNAKKPAGIEPAVNEVIDPKEKITLSNSAPNIHDFLNLPVKYSSSKFVYPLVSSSYANLKYQGSNKNYMTNKKPTSIEATAVTPMPDYNHQNQFTIHTTKLMAVPSSATKFTPSPISTTKPTTTITTTTTTTTTTRRPSTPTTVISMPITRPTSTSVKTSVATSTSIITPPKYSTVSRKPIPVIVSSTTPTPPKLTTTTTRKKFMPTKKYTPTLTTPQKPATPLRFPDQEFANSTTQLHVNQIPTKTTAMIFTTRKPVKQTTTSPTDATRNTKQPITFTEHQSSFIKNTSPAITTSLPNVNTADIYQTLGQKNTLKETNTEQKPSMSLADIFNSLAEEESTVTSNNRGTQGIDDNNNLMHPFVPSKPSPFATHNTATTGRPTQSVISVAPTHYQQNGQQPLQQLFKNDQKVISDSQENFSNEYVSYQVQQPNVMQYRPAPGAINNVVISAGQNSASFVLGSQQQVGPNAFGTVEKEPLFGKDRPVQYGTVINELPPQKGNTYPQLQSPSPSLQNTGSIDDKDEPPAPPSPYQQLPLIGDRNLRPHTAKPQINSLTIINNITSSTNQPSNFQQTPQQAMPISEQSNQSGTKEQRVQSNIRFPINDEQSEERVSGPDAVGPPAGPHVNGHAQPLSLQQIQQQSNNVVFPQTKDEEQNSLQYQGSIGSPDIQIQQHEVVTMNQHKQKLNFPQSLEHQTPSTQMRPPPPPQASATSSEYTDLHKRPHINRPHVPPPPFAYNEYTRKPIPGITRPNSDRNLPNILPQFRPNAKISSGHPGPNFNHEPGNIRIPPGTPIKRPGPNAGPPQFAHRRQPLMQQPRYPAHRASDYPVVPSGVAHPIEANRRIYRLPPYGGQGFPYVDRTYGRPPMPYAVVQQNLAERHSLSSEPELYKTLTNQDLDLPQDRLAAFEEEDLVINDPPQPVTPSKDRMSVDETKLEPVVTLQMLQSQKKPPSLQSDDTRSGEIQVLSKPENSEDNLETPYAQDGLYVVYPMADKNRNASNANNLKDVTPAVAQVESATRSEYQNTPFSVVRDQPQEPILTVKNKKPQSLQQQAHLQTLKDKFPYPIEKPDPSFTELNAQNRISGVFVAPRIVHGIHSTGTETPIAVAYTPTEPSPYKKHFQKYSNVNLASSVIGEIRTESQTEDGFNNDFDLRGQNLEKNFMAPFYPSVSLGTATSAPANGWNILSTSTDSTVYEKNNINRADVADTSSSDSSADSPNNTFESDNFQPELQGGFKPIYPAGYKIDDNDNNENYQQHEINNQPLALASRMETTPHASIESTSTTAAILSTNFQTTSKPENNIIKSGIEKLKSSEGNTTQSSDLKLTEDQLSADVTTTMATIAPKSTSPPTQRKKTPFETSLEALLFGEDEEFDNEARKQKSTAISSPRIAPRSGPRSLKLS